jgi:LysM repeat protein
MLRQKLMNSLLAVAGISALLVGYNSFIAKHDALKGTTVADKLTSYLKLESAKQDADMQVAEVTVPTAETPAAEGEVPVDESVADSPAAPEPAPTPEVMKKEEAPVAVVAPSVVVAGAKAASTYVVKEGDTYGCIAEKYYGSFENWVDVDAVNPNTEGFLERRLFVGATLTLPALTAEQVKPASSLCS